SSGLAPCVTLCLTSPPRRSSDLGAAPVVDTPPHHQRGTGAAGPAHAAITTIGSGLAILGAVGEAGPIGAGRAIAATAIDHYVLRSEEHTSELQSRENLVCRLLLE